MKIETLANIKAVADREVVDKEQAVEAITQFARELAEEENRLFRLAGRLMRYYMIGY